jgi:PncC family amidohydrolase
MMFAERLAVRLVKQLRERGLCAALAESCTAGLAASLIGRVPGASDVFWGGFVTYTLRAKRTMLGIDAAILERHGAVSGECARAMAERALAVSGAGLAISITGLAGPGGDGSATPVGTVWVAGARAGGRVLTRLHRFAGGRNSVRQKAAAAAFRLGLELIL